jgi:hypothetical protein
VASYLRVGLGKRQGCEANPTARNSLHLTRMPRKNSLKAMRRARSFLRDMDDLLSDLRLRLRSTNYSPWTFDLPGFRGCFASLTLEPLSMTDQRLRTSILRVKDTRFFLKIPLALKAHPSPGTAIVTWFCGIHESR